MRDAGKKVQREQPRLVFKRSTVKEGKPFLPRLQDLEEYAPEVCWSADQEPAAQPQPLLDACA